MLSEVQKQLKRLYLTKVIDTLPSRVSQAHTEALSHLEWLQLILQDEVEHRNSQSLQKRLQRACFEQECTFANYQLGHYAANIQRLINDLRNGDYLLSHHHVLLMGPTGTGKTHLAQALGHQACIQEQDVQFIRANRLLEEWDHDRNIDASTQRLKKYLKAKLLIIDDFGLRNLSANQANDLYELVVAKEHKSSFIESIIFFV